MNTVWIMVVLVIAGVGFGVILMKGGSRSENRDSEDSSTPSPPQAVEQSAPASSPQQGSSSLLAQLSIINCSSFPALSLKQLPAVVECFVGRATILQDITGKPLDNPALICLYGKSGIGKSTLAIKLGHEFIPKYTDAQLYIDMKGEASNPLSVAKVMAHVVRSFYPTESLPTDTGDLLNAYRAVLKGKRVLMILKNVPPGSPLKRILPPKSCMLIVTSPNAMMLPNMINKEVKEMAAHEAEGLINYYSQRAKHWANDINSLCGNLPLGITLAGAYINTNQDILGENFVSQLKEERRCLKPEGEENDKKEEDPQDLDIQGIYNLVYRDLRKDTASVLRRLVFFAGTFDAKAETAICGDRDNEHLKQLVALKLVEYDPPNNRYQLHDAIRKLAERDLRPSERILSSRSHSFYYQSVLSSANELYEPEVEGQESALNMFDLDWPNMEAGQAWAATKCEEDLDIAKLCGDYVVAGETLMGMRIPPKDTIAWHEAALSSSRQLQNIELEKVNLLRMGVEFFNMSQFERAVEFLEEAQVLSTQLGDVGDEKKSMHFLGKSCLALNQSTRAVECFEKVLEVTKIEGNKKNEMEALENLAEAHYKADNFKNAVDHYQLALAMAQKVGKRVNAAQILLKLGSLHVQVNKAPAALTYFNQALTLAQQSNNRTLENNILQQTAEAHLLSKNYKRAIGALEKALILIRRIGDKKVEGVILKRLGDFHVSNNDYPKAITNYEKGLPHIQKTSFKEVEFSLLENLGSAHSHLQKYEQAAICFRHARTLAKRMADPGREIQSLWSLALTMEKKGEAPKALNWAEEAVRLCERNMKPEVRAIEKEIKDWIIRRVERSIEDAGM